MKKHNNEDEDMEILDEQTGSKTPTDFIAVQNIELSDDEILEILAYAKKLMR